MLQWTTYGAMPGISSLSQFQIQRLFDENRSSTQLQRDVEAQRITGRLVTATACQGGSSYTEESKALVVQFRASKSTLDIALMQSVKQAN